MTEYRRESRERAYRRKMRKRKQMIKRYITLGGVVLAVVVVIILLSNCAKVEPSGEDTTESNPVTTTLFTTEPTATVAPTDEPYIEQDEDYPYSIMSKDWGGEVYEQGFKYYEIPSSYKMAGGTFPEVAQVYLWCICREAGVDYYTALALIERESGYKWDATGDSGASKGLMQIGEKWYREEMDAMGITDLYNPYANMSLGVSILKEIQDKYLASSGAHCVLMVYNMGASGAKECWKDGIYSTAYTRQILKRAQEIKQELQDQ